MSDKMYQSAIEANFSHEQMTPLNCIINNSKLVHDQLAEIVRNHPTISRSRVFNQTLLMLDSVNQSGMILFYFNQNQIQRMKIKQNQFHQYVSQTFHVHEHIQEVLFPFETQIASSEVEVFCANFCPPEFAFVADWKIFECIMFNVVQNAVKYNQPRGKIVFVLRIRDQNGGNSWLDVEVMDTGIGIEKERQGLLFQAFKELKQTQNLKLVKDNSIGLGLASSSELITKLGGSICLKQSEKNLTVFNVSMPVSLQQHSIRNSDCQLQKENQISKILVAQKDELLQKYLIQQNVTSLFSLKIMQRKHQEYEECKSMSTIQKQAILKNSHSFKQLTSN